MPQTIPDLYIRIDSQTYYQWRVDPTGYIRLDALKSGRKCTPGKTVECGNVCRKPENCKKKGSESASTQTEASAPVAEKKANAARSGTAKQAKPKPQTETQAKGIVKPLETAKLPVVPPTAAKKPRAKKANPSAIEGSEAAPVKEKKGRSNTTRSSKTKIEPASNSETIEAKPRKPRSNNKTQTARVDGNKLTKEQISALESEIQDSLQNLKKGKSETEHADWVLHAILEKQGFNGKPDVVTSKSLDNAIKSGDLEMFRGLSSIEGKTGVDLAEQYRSGENYAGKGIMGNGTYTAYGKDVSRVPSYTGTDGKGAIVRMSLKKDARVISYEDLMDQIDNDDRFSGNSIFTKDPGRYAALMGYDAIDTKDMGADFMVILNRGATRIQKENLSKIP